MGRGGLAVHHDCGLKQPHAAAWSRFRPEFRLCQRAAAGTGKHNETGDSILLGFWFIFEKKEGRQDGFQPNRDMFLARFSGWKLLACAAWMFANTPSQLELDLNLKKARRHVADSNPSCPS